MPDLDLRELAMVAALAVPVLWMGVYPESFLAPMRADISALEARLARAKPAGDAQLGAAKGPKTEMHAEHGEAH